MTLQLGDTAPDFDADTTEGRLNFYDWLGGDSWAVLFSHPKDFTPVCTTELGHLARLKPQFDRDPSQRTPADDQTVRNVFIIGPDKKVNLVLVYPMTTGRNSTRCSASSTPSSSPRSTGSPHP